MAGNADDFDRDQKLDRACELMQGRFTRAEVKRLLEIKEWDTQDAIKLFFESDPADLRELLETASEETIKSVQRDDVLKDLALRDEVNPIVRQFACDACQLDWWHRVPYRKQISMCRTCNQKYDPIPKSDEYGWAIFVCECGNEFSGFGQMNKTQSMCYKQECGRMVFPSRISRRKKKGPPKSKSTHSCSGGNCFNHSHGPANPGSVCNHPKSGGKKVLVASKPHHSTGSSVATFLSQSNFSDTSSNAS